VEGGTVQLGQIAHMAEYPADGRPETVHDAQRLEFCH